MDRPPIDDATAERLLSGRLSPDDAPPGYVGVAGLFQTMTGPPVSTDLAHEAPVVTAAVGVVRSASAGHSTSSWRKSMLPKSFSPKVVALAAAALLGASGVAAAATGSLPAGVQSTVSNQLARVSVSVPHPGSGSSGHGQANSHKPADQGANPKADFGQCTAFLAGSHATTSTTLAPETTTAPSTTLAPDTTTAPSTTLAPDTTTVPSTTSTIGGPGGKLNSTAFSDLIADHGGTVASTTTYCQAVIAAHKAAHGPQSTSTTTTATTVTTGTTGEPSDNGDSSETGKASETGKPSDTHGRPSSPGASGSHGPGSTAGSGGTGGSDGSGGPGNGGSHGQGATHRR